MIREVMRLLEEKSVKSCRNLFRKDGHRSKMVPDYLNSWSRCGSRAAMRMLPKRTQQMSSPAPTVSARDRVGIAENQRDDDAVRDDRAERAEEAMLTECIGSEGTEQGSEGAEDDVRQGASGQDVCEEAADGDAWNRSRCEKREDRQHLGKAHLDGTACEIEAGGERGQYDVECGDHSGLNDGQNVA